MASVEDLRTIEDVQCPRCKRKASCEIRKVMLRDPYNDSYRRLLAKSLTRTNRCRHFEER